MKRKKFYSHQRHLFLLSLVTVILSLILSVTARASTVSGKMVSAIDIMIQPPSGSPTPTVNPTATETSTPIPSPTSSPTLNRVTDQELLATYKDLVEANKRAVDAAYWTLNFGLALAAFVGTVLTGLGAWSLITARKANRMANEVSKDIKKLEQSRAKLEQELEGLHTKSQRLEQELKTSDTLLKQSKDEIEKLTRLQNDLGEALEKQRQQIEGDTKILERLYSSAEVDRYAMQFFGDDDIRQKAGRQGLLQLSRNPDPIIRRECLRVFKVMPDHLENWMDKEILAQIDYLMQKDKERGIRKEAETVIKNWQERGGKQLKLILNEIRKSPPESAEK